MTPEQRIAELELECARLRVDAERYAWLRDNALPSWPRDYATMPLPHAEIEIYLCRLENGNIERFGAIGPAIKVGIVSLDAAVDEAMAVAATAPMRAEGI